MLVQYKYPAPYLLIVHMMIHSKPNHHPDARKLFYPIRTFSRTW